MHKFNDWLANKLGDVLGNMYFFYFCLALDIVMLFPVIKAHSTITWVTYISQTVIQLLALPILQVYQNLHQDHHDEVMDHLKKIHKEVKKS